MKIAYNFLFILGLFSSIGVYSQNDSFLFLDDQSLINSNTDLTAAIEESSVSVIDSWSSYAMIAFALAAIATGPLLFFFVKWSRELLIGVLLIVILVGLIDESNGSFVVITEL